MKNLTSSYSGYFVATDGKILVEDIVKLGTASEVIDGNLHDVEKEVQKISK
jgi:hypothetical protein